MADKPKSGVTDTAIAELAKQIFVEQFGHSQIGYKQLTINSFRAATEFLAGAQSVQNGEIDLFEEDRNPLDDAKAPNLKKTHPINLMSKAWGDVRLVQAALDDLDANPAAETYEPYGWGKPEVNQARALFPAVVNRAKQLSTTK